MVFKLENSQIVIDGKSMIKALALVYICRKIYKAIHKPEPKCCVILGVELNKEQQPSKKKKVESV